VNLQIGIRASDRVVRRADGNGERKAPWPIIKPAKTAPELVFVNTSATVAANQLLGSAVRRFSGGRSQLP
jgi:hypothetical protein